jgi:hypothetical protein
MGVGRPKFVGLLVEVAVKHQEATVQSAKLRTMRHERSGKGGDFLQGAESTPCVGQFGGDPTSSLFAREVWMKIVDELVAVPFENLEVGDGFRERAAKLFEAFDRVGATDGVALSAEKLGGVGFSGVRKDLRPILVKHQGLENDFEAEKGVGYRKIKFV